MECLGLTISIFFSGLVVILTVGSLWLGVIVYSKTEADSTLSTLSVDRILMSACVVPREVMTDFLS